MSTELIVALVSAVIAVMSAVLSLYGQIRVARLTAEREEKREEKAKKERMEELLSRYREPLLHSAFELQSRAFNILKMDMMGKHYKNGTERDKTYVVNNTLYVIAQYLGWSEIIRREMQFLDLGELDRTRQLSKAQDDVCNVFLNHKLGRVLRIFRGDQRAIGELMMIRVEGSGQCIGYATFVSKLAEPEFASWFGEIKEGLLKLVDDPSAGQERLVDLQHELIDIIDYLDPDCVRFPRERRQKV